MLPQKSCVCGLLGGLVVKNLPARLLVQEGRVEGCVLISCYESTKTATSCWTTINRRLLEPTENDVPHKMTKKPQWDSRRGAITIKSNPIPTRWVIHRLETSNTKEVLPLLWRFRTPHQVSQPGDLTKGLEISRESGLEGQQDLIIGLPEDCGKHRLQSWRA